MSNMVTIKIDDQTFIIPMHEFSRYWLPNLPYVKADKLPQQIPRVSKMAGLKRGEKFECK